MKPIRHVSQLDQILDRSLAWRKKELTGLKFVVDTAREKEDAILCRAGIALLYAHWEGFTKETALAYLRLVASQALPLSRLTTNFVAISLANDIRHAARTAKTSIHAGLVDRITGQLGTVRFTKWRGSIQTKSNLKSPVFREILASLNLDDAAYSSSMHKVIDRLVDLRNAVAHGQYLSVLPSDYDSIYRDVMAVVDVYRDQISDAAATKRYLR